MAVARPAPSTFFEASSSVHHKGWGKFIWGRKSHLCATPSVDSVCGCSLLEGFVGALHLSCHATHPALIVGVAPYCDVPACASTFSLHWSVLPQFGVIVVVRFFAADTWPLLLSLADAFAADVAPISPLSHFATEWVVPPQLWILCRVDSGRCFAAGGPCSGRYFAAVLVSSRWMLCHCGYSFLLAVLH